MKHLFVIVFAGFFVFTSQTFAQSSPGCAVSTSETVYATSGMIRVLYFQNGYTDWQAIAVACRDAKAGCEADKAATDEGQSACEAYCAQFNPNCAGNAGIAWGPCVTTPSDCAPGPLDAVASAVGTKTCSCNNWSEI